MLTMIKRRLYLLMPVVLLLALPIFWLLNELTPESEPQTSPPAPDGYTLVFEDEFDQQGLDATKWRLRFEAGTERGAGVIARSAVQQPGDGYLHLVTDYLDGQLLTGMIRSTQEFKYGYFEARIKFQELQGHHGAFWLQSPLYGQYHDDPARSGAEIDVIEFFGGGRTETDAQQSIYWNAYDSEDLQHRSHDVFYREQHATELSQEFHTFALLWTPEEYVFYIDGVETWRTSEGLSQVPQYLVLSLESSTWENTRLDVDRLPDEMLVDYVRVFAR